MASANLELVRSICTAWEGGDYSAANWAHADIEYVIADGPTPGRWTGVSGMAEAWRDYLSTWEEWHVETEEYRELAGGRVLVLQRGGGRGKGSRVEVAQMRAKMASVFHIRGDKVTRLVAYFDREHALAELDLSS
jgi:ketosteroid isomerase-like protein